MRSLTLFIALTFVPFAHGEEPGQDLEMHRIFSVINFMTYQLSLDGKPADISGALTDRQVPAREMGKTLEAREKPSPKQTAEAKPVTRAFTAKTIWADLDVTVLDYGTHMTFQVKCSRPSQGWMLQKGNSSNILFKGNVEGNAHSFEINIPRQYSPDLGLTVFVTNDDSQNPAFIALK